jgi:Lon protease-like protein
MNQPRTTGNFQVQHRIAGLSRILFLFALISIFLFFAGWLFEPDLSEEIKNFWRFPPIEFFRIAFNPHTARYLLAPVSVIIFVTLAAGSYVRDIYALPRLRQGIRYVISSLFALFVPRIIIDGGEKKLEKNEVNLIDSIGGPGHVVIQPGNAVMFKELRRPSRISIRESYYLRPFETIGQIVNLDEQQDSRSDIPAVTRDGIRVTIKDIQFRYRLFPELQFGRPKRRTIDEPYPFDEKALWNSAYNLPVTDAGPDNWRTVVGRAVVGGITDFISEHDIDYLTAPRESGIDPRREIRYSLLYGPTRTALRNNGAELIWVDIGHFEIDPAVDEQRTDYWAADWLGNAQVQRAYGEAKRQVFLEMGRAEAHAEMIIALTEALKDVNWGEEPSESIRKLLILRTAEMIENWINSRNRSDKQQDGQNLLFMDEF